MLIVIHQLLFCLMFLWMTNKINEILMTLDRKHPQERQIDFELKSLPEMNLECVISVREERTSGRG